MLTNGLDEERAFEFLIRLSQTNNVKLRQVAEDIVLNRAGGERVNAERERPSATRGRPRGRGSTLRTIISAASRSYSRWVMVMIGRTASGSWIS